MTTALDKLPYAKGLPEALRAGYEWFSPNNRSTFAAHMEGLNVADNMKLTTQVELYKHKIMDVFGYDLAERAQALAAPTFSEPGARGGSRSSKNAHIVQGSDYPLPTTFTVPIREYYDASSYELVQQYWTYRQLSAYGQIVPPHALTTLARIVQEPIKPDQAWVAVKEEQRTSVRPLLDPLLCVSFGRWIVPIAEWK